MKKKVNDLEVRNRKVLIYGAVSILIVSIALVIGFELYYFKLSGYATGPGGTTINYISPTPVNGYKTNQQTFSVSMSSSDTSPSNGEHSAFLDYDKSLFALY